MSHAADTQLATAVHLHGHALRRYAQSLLRDGVADPDDVMQEVWIRAHASLPLDGDQLGWLYRVTRNCAVDARRAAGRHAPAHDLEAVATSSSVVDDVAAREAVRQAFADIASLEARQRTAFVRHAVDGASHDEVAEELSVSHQASRSLVLRARRNLLRRAEARSLSCPSVRESLASARRKGHRPAELVRLHLQTCRACRRHRDAESGRSSRAWLGLPWLKLAALAAVAAGAAGATWPVTREEIVEPYGDPATRAWSIGPGTAIGRHHVERSEGSSPTRAEIDLRCPKGYVLFQVDQGNGPRHPLVLGLGPWERWLGRTHVRVPVTPRPPVARLPERFTIEALCLTPDRVEAGVRRSRRRAGRPERGRGAGSRS